MTSRPRRLPRQRSSAPPPQAEDLDVLEEAEDEFDDEEEDEEEEDVQVKVVNIDKHCVWV